MKSLLLILVCLFSGLTHSAEAANSVENDSVKDLETHKAASGLVHRTDLVTFFDYYAGNEGRRS